ncbi:MULTISPECIES: PD-(D/E)XK nuclease family protein [unclassified Dehalobacter]|uniref:PD-(D/E)XK nuclease family protein n=1 Tax=unclassified Dehalobacter TaxID=2635733 RepID=UPI000E6C0E82|nr:MULTISPECIES: PD-(D/E)XK nuclease family protein [unclassified Dehalobacter]RJE49267.1 helicase-exonuclease AddAB subunit AddB [Dehalobacter sp. MCB1]TCX53316.1 helicase-exonuclease AddAB subunit AddB [Dehalobacter sp. 14DCB1]TCX54330.1 helicase-exonuclease AddAB subunit AddB [Dehalobacter sp. 12DCB1]
MSLRFIYGRSGSGKSTYCLNEIKERVNNGADHPLVLLVPEQYTLQAERDLINVLKTGGILKTEVLSFRRLAFRVFNEAGGITYPHIHPAGKSMLIYRVLMQIKEELKVYTRSAERKGFISSLSGLITELKRYNVTPEDLQNAIAVMADQPLKDKLTELNAVYSGFEELIRQRYRDSDDDLTLTAAKLESTTIFDGAEIWIDGFAGFTPQEYKVITMLLLKVSRVNICLCTDSLAEEGLLETDVFSEVKGVYRKFKKICQEAGLEIEPPVQAAGFPLPRFRCSAELSHLERYCDVYPHRVYTEATRDIFLHASVNIYAEIEAAAADIVRLCRDRGLRYRDIAVVTGNLDGYRSFLETVFAEYEIPYFLDRKTEITDQPLVRMMLAMLDIFSDNWSYETVFAYLKTGLSGLDRERIDHIENYVLACGIRGSRWTKNEDWTMHPGLLPEENQRPQDVEKAEAELKEINQTRREIAAPLLQFRAKTKNRKKASEICEALYDFLGGIGVPARLERIMEEFRRQGMLNLANEYGQVWNILMNVLDQTVETMGEEPLSLESFTDTLKIGFAEYQIGLIPASLDQVLIGSIERFRSHEIKALFILGVNDGVFPATAQTEGILADADRAALNTVGIELANDTRTQAFQAQYLIYRSLTTASAYLRLSWPIADQEGRSLRPSMVIYRLRKLFPKITENSTLIPMLSGFAAGKENAETENIGTENTETKNTEVVNAGTENTWLESAELEQLTGKSPSFKQMVAAFRRKAEGLEINGWWQDVYRWYNGLEEWKPRCEALQTAFSARNIAEPVSSEKITALYGASAHASASRLEKYASCQFAFYLQYGLEAKERKIYQFSPPDVGTFMHAVLERFSLEAAQQQISWREMERPWCREKVSEIVDEMLRKMQGSGLTASQRYTSLALRLKRVITRAVWMIAEHLKRSGFEPLGYELGFGEREKFPPIVIELDSGRKVSLSGRIDRVDALEAEEGTYLRIVDYKSGSKDFKLADVYYGLQIQLFTYLDALWQNSGLETEKPVLPGGILYFRIDDPIVRADGRLTEEEIELDIMKQLKMKGLLLADVKLIKEMDRTIDGTSLIIPARINKGDLLGKSSAATLEQFEILRKYVRNLLKDLCEEMMSGSVSITPYKKKRTTSCTYCHYAAVCQFDPARKENSFRLLADRGDEEIWNDIMKAEQNHD